MKNWAYAKQVVEAERLCFLPKLCIKWWNRIRPLINFYDIFGMIYHPFRSVCSCRNGELRHANQSRSRAVVFPPQTLYGVVKPDTPSNNEDKHWEVKGKYLVCRQMVGENQHHDVPKVRCEMIQLHWKIDLKQIHIKFKLFTQAVSKFCSLLQ